MFQAEIQVQPKEGLHFCLFLNLQSKIVVTMPNWKKAFFPPQVGAVMGIFSLSPYSRKSVSRKVFSYLSNRSNRMFGFFSSEKEDTSGRQQCSPHSSLLSQFTVLLKSYCLLLTLPARKPEVTVACEDEAGPEVVLLWAVWGSVLSWGLQQQFSGGSADARLRPFPSLLSARAAAKLLSEPLQKHLDIGKGSVREGKVGDKVTSSLVFMRGDNCQLGQ